MKKFMNSFLFAARGIAVAFTDQLNLKVQTACIAVVVSSGFYFDLSDIEWCCLLLAAGLVITLEMVNTSIEKLVDLVTSEFHPLAARVKDIGAGAVLFGAIVSVIVGWLVFRPHAIAWWQSW
jgi:diacylglycerol kinase